MLVNLAVPYRCEPSQPRSLEMAFYACAQSDFLFTRGHVEITCQPLKRAMSLEWKLCRNLLVKPLATGASSSRADNSFLIALDMENHAPGFFNLHVVVKLSETDEIKGHTTFGWRVMDEPLVNSMPTDFEEFWSIALDSLPDPQPSLQIQHQFNLAGAEINQYNRAKAALPENYDPEGVRFNSVEVSKVDFMSWNGARVYGWFAKPVGPGPFPGLLVLPGAGNDPRPAPVEHARHGYAALDIQVHGNKVDDTKYDALPEPTYTTPQDYRHYDVYLNAVQASRVLAHLPGVDPDRIAVTGGSQGGRLSVVVAALNKQIRAAVPGIAHYAYRPWLQWVERCNKLGDAGASPFRQDDLIQDDQGRIEAYYDSANFAPLVACPVLMNAGLIDDCSPPTGVFAIYRRLNVPKEMVALPNLAHDWSPFFDRYAWRWLTSVLGK